MNKDIIYIDTEDDITAIIGKIKKANEKIVALVPPKRTGVLQSAVNLRLLSRMAKKEGKELVLISANKALIALSAAAKIPVAKNLQSKPEIAEIAALEVDDGEDIIDGSNLPVGDLVKISEKKPGDDIAKDLGSIDIDDEAVGYVPPSAAGSDDKKPAKIAKPKNGVKVPNFGKFRKKLFMGIAAGILFIIFLIWAIWFAPSAKVIITAKTQAAPVSMTLNLGGTAPTNISTNTVQTVTKQIKKDLSVDFTATGSKTVGTSAKGNVIFKNCETLSPQTIASGTTITSNGLSYTTQSSVTVPAGTGGFGGCTAAGVSTPVAVMASDIGSNYNTANGTTFSVANHSNSSGVYLRAVATTEITGGESHQATVVTAIDVQKAKQALVDQNNSDVKKQLTRQFTNGETVVTDSFKADYSDATSVPAIDAEATGGKAKLTSPTTFSMTAIAKSELVAFLRDAITKQMDASKNQRIYDDGYSKVVLSGYQSGDNGAATVNVATTGQFGPNIDKEAIKNQVKGKNFGDAQALLSSINNVSNVDIKFPYFWVTTIPNDTNKITVQFQISNA
ncbi:MAG: hypothetical protein NTV39_01490 [Candidatus Saccharibacteria bacterium]|nr:hypothetical protein [Candidatus Saccharibacteria bacterium]